MAKNTIINYMYRDADNYKVSEEAIVSGPLPAWAFEKVKESLDDGQFFIPSQVGLRDLQGELQGWDSEDHDTDHCWHELCEIGHTDREPTAEMTAREFYEKMTKTEFKEFEPGHILENQ